MDFERSLPGWLQEAVPPLGRLAQQPVVLEQPCWRIGLTGADTLRFLHGQTTRKLQDAAAGQLLSSCAVTATARLLALLEVAVGQAAAEVLVWAGDGVALQERFDRYLFPADQVTLGPARRARLLTVLTPAPRMLTADGNGWADGELDAGWRGCGAGGEAHLQGPLQLAGTGLTLAGFRLLLPPDDDLPAVLRGCERIGDAAADVLRLQRGRPAAPGEVHEDFNPFEVGLAAAVSLQKGCYVGQETLARLVTHGGLKQQLRFWRASAPPDALARDQRLVDGDGERVGRITSVASIPSGSCGLAMVRRRGLAATDVRCGEVSIHLEVPPAATFPPSPST